MLTINMLGGLRIYRDDELLTDFRSVKIEAMLAYLAYHQGETIDRDVLMNLLWSEKGVSRARANLRQSLSRMKSSLQPEDSDPEYAVIDRNSTLLDARLVRVDVHLFESLLKACPEHGRRHDTDCSVCVDNLTQALAMYEGDFLDNFYVDDSPDFEAWLVRTRENLHRQAVDALRLMTDYHEARANYDRALSYARRLIAMDAFSEPAHCQYMRLLARQGERSVALSHYQTLRQMLLDELGVEPAPETEHLVTHIRRVSDRRPHNLPRSAGKTIIGREQERAYIRQLLADETRRLITLIGIGGTGKTTLALQVGQSVVDEYFGPFMDGVCLVHLAGFDNETGRVSAGRLVNTLSQFFALSFPGKQSTERELVQYLQGKECLIIIDNAEILGDDSKRLIQILLQQTDRVQILVTSRTRLNIMGEWIVDITGLSFPQPSDVPQVVTALDTLDALIDEYDALQLFTERARQIQADFHWSALSDDDRRAVVRISQMTQGLCLALELAATWTGKLSCVQIADEIAASLDILDAQRYDLPERHRSMRAVFNYSWSLLSDEEQTILANLAVFPGSFDLSAAKQIAGATLKQVSGLIDKSLIRTFEQGDVMRYRLHPLLRQFLLEYQDDTDELQLLHADYYATVIREQEKAAGGIRQMQNLTVFEHELDNLLAAWSWLIRHPDTALLTLYVQALHHYFMIRSLYTQGIEHFQAAMQALKPDVPAADVLDMMDSDRILLYCQIVSRLASFQQATGRTTEAEASVQEARQYIRLVENGEEIVQLHSKMAEIARNYGQYEQARNLMAFSLQVADDINDEPQKARLLMLMGAMERDSGYFEKALDYMQQSLALYRQLEFDWGIAHTQRLTGGILLEQNELSEAAVCFQKALMLFQKMKDTTGATLVYRELGKLACEREDWSAADEHFTQALKLTRESSDIKGSALVYQDIGRYHLQRKRPKRARDYLLSCFQTATRIRDIPLVLESLLDIVQLQIALQPPDTNADSLPNYLAELMSFVYVRARNQPLLRKKAHRLLSQYFPDDAPDRSADMVLTLDDLRDRVEQYVN